MGGGGSDLIHDARQVVIALLAGLTKVWCDPRVKVSRTAVDVDVNGGNNAGFPERVSGHPLEAVCRMASDERPGPVLDEQRLPRLSDIH